MFFLPTHYVYAFTAFYCILCISQFYQFNILYYINVLFLHIAFLIRYLLVLSPFPQREFNPTLPPISYIKRLPQRSLTVPPMSQNSAHTHTIFLLLATIFWLALIYFSYPNFHSFSFLFAFIQSLFTFVHSHLAFPKATCKPQSIPDTLPQHRITLYS